MVLFQIIDLNFCQDLPISETDTDNDISDRES